MALPAISTLDLFDDVSAGLLDVLESLPPPRWQTPTVVPGRTVADLASHLLDGTIRRLSATRDGHYGPAPDGDLSDHDVLVDHIQRLNRAWMDATRRVSPRILLSLLRHCEPELVAYFRTLDPDAPAAFPVSWAGHTVSPTWFDVAREYTEKWHHQMQIRLAVGAPLLDDRRLYHPVLDAFLRALPHVYRDAAAAPGIRVRVVIEGPAGGVWTITRDPAGWGFTDHGEAAGASTTIRVPQTVAWRLFTNCAGPDGPAAVRCEGDASLLPPLLGMVTIMQRAR